MPAASNPAFLNTGIMILRIGIGLIFVMLGYPKLLAGPELWGKIGSNMSIFHITFLPVFWGFMAAFAEAVGGLLLALGIFVRPAAFLLLCTMIVATAHHINAGDPFSRFSPALAMGVVALSLLIAGGGRFALGHIILPLRDKWLQ